MEYKYVNIFFKGGLIKLGKSKNRKSYLIVYKFN